MKPLDFVFSRAPLIDLDDEAAARMEGLVEAVDKFAVVLGGSLAVLGSKGEARDAAREEFFLRTQDSFEKQLKALQASMPDWEAIAQQWIQDLRVAAFAIFEALALPGLADLNVKKQNETIDAQRNLSGAFAGYGKLGSAAYSALGLTVPEQCKKQKGKGA